MPRLTALFTSLVRRRGILIPGVLCLFLAILYFLTIAPGITWAFDGADGGDLVTAVATGGVPHPTGYPTYLLIATLFLKIPFGSLAFRTNLLSSVCTVAAAYVIFKIMRSTQQSVFSASIAALAFGTFPLIWSQAIITEVNALTSLFTALIIYFFLVKHPQPITDLVGGLVLGMAAGNHLSTLLMFPLVFVSQSSPLNLSIKASSRIQSLCTYFKIIGRRFIGLLLGLCIYSVIPFRAQAQAPVNWGNAVNWDGLIWLVSGKMYWGRLDYFNGKYLLDGIQVWSSFLVQQLGLLGLVLVFVVIALLFKPSLLYLGSCWLIVVYSVFSVLYYSPDSYVYLIPALIAFSFWIGAGSEWCAVVASKRFPYFRSIVIVAISACFVVRAVVAIPAMNLSSDHTAEQYARSILESAPSNAILITVGDEEAFSLWYFHYAYHLRPDVAVVSGDLLVQPWYHVVLKRTYPGLVVPDEPWTTTLEQANFHRPVCQLPSILQPKLECIG